jgi:hypothetical protein
MEVGPIPWTAVQGYGTAHRYDDEQLDALHHHVRALDQRYLQWLAKQRGQGGSRPVQPTSSGDRAGGRARR